MPRRRRPGIKALRETLTTGQTLELLSGPICDPPREFASESDRERAWREHKSEIMEACTRLSGRLRPAGWWKYDAPEPLRVLRVGHCAPDRSHPGGYEVRYYESELSGLLRCNQATPEDLERGLALLTDPREALRLA